METTDSLVDRLYKGILNRVNVEYKEALSEEPPPADWLYGNGQKFERLRRITGYLVGTVDRWNNGKKSELGDRVNHGTKD